MNKNDISSPRERIAKILSISVPAATGVLALVSILLAFYVIYIEKTPNNGIEIVKYTFTALLPLWGTWLGTVLAYYFSKENFESANRQVQEIVAQVTTVSEKLRSIKVKDVWILNNEKLAHLEFGSEKEILQLKVKDAIDFLETNNRQRLPIFLGKSILYIIHLSIFDRYIRLLAISGNSFEQHTIKDMLNCDDEKVVNSLKYGAAFVAENANLLDAKRIMDANIFCNDVFVTKNGYQGEEVLGWIADKIINENAKV